MEIYCYVDEITLFLLQPHPNKQERGPMVRRSQSCPNPHTLKENLMDNTQTLSRVAFRARAADINHMATIGHAMASAGRPFLNRTDVIRAALARTAAAIEANGAAAPRLECQTVVPGEAEECRQHGSTFRARPAKGGAV